MSDHSDLAKFLDSLDKMLDTIGYIIYTARCKIRVEQRLDDHASSSQEEVSGSSKTNALPSESRQGGPKPHVEGTPKERDRSTKETEKVLVRGGRMETSYGE